MVIKNIKYEKNKYYLEIDSGDVVEILEDTLVKFNLFKNMELEDILLDEIINHNMLQVSINYATRYLINIKTKKQIKDYLKSKNIKDEIIDKTILYLEEKNYTDDLSYAKSYVYHGQNIKKYGINKIKYMLLNKGISSIDLESALYDIDYELEFLNCKTLLIDKLKEDYSQKNIEKAFRFLINRGFTYDYIKKSLESLKNE